MKTKTITVVSVLIITLCLLELLNASTPNLGAPPEKESTKVDTGVPEFVAYGFLFRKMARLTKKTRELRSQGELRGFTVDPNKWVWCFPNGITILARVYHDVRFSSININGSTSRWPPGSEFYP